MYEQERSFLAFEIERQLPDRDEYSSRNMRVHYRNHDDPEKVDFSSGYVKTFNIVGRRIAVAQKYQDGMLGQLGVDAVIEVDVPNLLLEEPFIFEQTRTNTAGMTLTGSSRDQELMNPNRSTESVMLNSGGQFIGPLQAGFLPRQEVFTPIGKTSGNQPVRLKIYDLRPKPAMGVPPLEPRGRV